MILPNPDLIYPAGAGAYGFTSGAVALLLEAALARRYPERAPRFTRLGKPHAPLFDEARRRLGGDRLLMIGDQLETDIAGALAAGIDAALVVTGVTRWRRALVVPTYLLEPESRARFDPCLRARHGVVLASARGPVRRAGRWPATDPRSWWGHPRSHEIFRALSAIDDCPDVLCFKIVAGKVTFVHRRLWPALVRLAEEIGRDRSWQSGRITPSPRHRNIVTPFPEWVSADISPAARSVDPAAARPSSRCSSRVRVRPRSRA